MITGLERDLKQFSGQEILTMLSGNTSIRMEYRSS
jgi:hypothetical protein